MRSGRILALVLLVSSPAIAEVRKPPPSETAPEALIERAHRHEAKQEWAAARDLYRRLASVAGYRKAALYHQARMAQRLLEDDALELARHAVLEGPGPYHFEAKVLYGEILFSQGLYERAKRVFLVLRKAAATRPLAKTLEAKVIAANRALGLFERDGL